ncbi:hypothetical protein A3D69_03800 [Candidatus Uhrbacteria bacterium RIFCSPHIGHO2_02_FULL_54_11]|nr:MAG: hypothetical protein A3D69_03800 [Candidatus Uhrbacteria bacterium RIFCSPHIGHO2_02_FULL_54_11]
MSIKKKLIAAATAGNGFLAWASIAAATTVPTGLGGSEANLTAIGSAAQISGGDSSNLPTLIGNIINVILGLLGIVFVVLVIYSGIQYMLSRGESKKVEEATGNIRTAIIGLIITVAAYAISNYVIQALVTATT